MNLINLKHLGTTLVLISALAGCKANQSSDTASTPSAATAEASAATPMPAEPASTTTASEADATPMAIPDTADAIWQAIDKHRAELKTTIESGSLGEVHHHAFAIRDLVAALPAHSPTLPAEDQAKLAGDVKFVATLASRLDETGDAGDKAGSQANYDKLVVVLNGITRTK